MFKIFMNLFKILFYVTVTLNVYVHKCLLLIDLFQMKPAYDEGLNPVQTDITI